MGSGRILLVFATLISGLLIAPGGLPITHAAEGNEPSIRATNAVVIDADTGQVLFEKQMNQQVAPASLTKIFTAIVALETAPLDQQMTVDEYDLVGEASIGLVAGETVTMETLLYGLMLTSGNDSAMTLARELGNLPGDSPQESVARYVDRVNGTAERLGLVDTSLRNPHGLDQGDHYSTARDIAAVTRYAIDNPVFERLISTPYYADNGREMYNVNALLGAYQGLIGGKTGVTSKSGYSLVQVAEREGNTIIAVLLGSDRESWYLDAEILLNFGFEELRANPHDDSRSVITAGGLSALSVPEVVGSVSVGGNYTIDRLSDHEAVVRPSSPAGSEDSRSWRWAIVSIGTMAVALVVVLNFPAIVGMGALAIDRGSRIRFSAPPLPGVPSISTLVGSFLPSHGRRRSTRSQVSRKQEPDEHRWMPGGRSQSQLGSFDLAQEEVMESRVPYSAVESISPAQTRAESAIRYAMQGRYHIATEEFRVALERDPEVDLARCPGFWRMQPMGYISAAKAYMLNDQKDDARRLLTVVQLAHKSNSSLVGLFGRAIKHLDD